MASPGRYTTLPLKNSNADDTSMIPAAKEVQFYQSVSLQHKKILKSILRSFRISNPDS
uniref:Uncharacterized protein n=1 Tax=Lepeophtheirus salmonis TaxID=72036 RepID=A0A0K2TZI8_LEPSM